METTKKFPLKDGMFIIGIIFIIISSLVFLLLSKGTDQFTGDSFFGMFLVNYVFAIIYLIILIINGVAKFNLRIDKNDIEYSLLCLILFLISAFTLNLDIPIFKTSDTWLSIYIIATQFALILYAFEGYLNKIMKHILFFLLGASLILFSYYAIYLIPLYPIGLVGSFVFGFSLHIFVPLLLTIFTVIILIKTVIKEKEFLYSIIAGTLIPILFSIYFIYQWGNSIEKINHELNKTIIKGNQNKLPLWVNLSQNLPDDWITDRMIKSNFIYDSHDPNFRFFDIPTKNFNEIKHDPLVMMATFFHGKSDLQLGDKVKIMECLYDARHESQERLWSGKNLETSNIITHAKIYPEFRIAYTEKILSISNIASAQRFNRTEEAIYTFYLPEGSVATSLSLWINNREEKGILTTKGKADTAYKAIVGVESRDPSLVHWQEGNKISVRVFPCTPEENRRFKIGFTSPLKLENDNLVYENIYYKGPAGDDATENIDITFNTKPVQLEADDDFNKDENKLTYEGKHIQNWNIKFKYKNISNELFSFDGNTYHVSSYNKKYHSFTPTKFYLDINKSWTEEEFEEVWSHVQNKEVYVYDGSLIKLNKDNAREHFNNLRKLNFSIFPFYEIKNLSSSLCISKSNILSPNLKELGNSDFSADLTEFLSQGNKINFYNIGENLSPYLNTLKSFRAFNYDQGDTKQLISLLNKKQFIEDQEDEHSVVIDYAGIKITEQNGTTNQQAPDHLLRLFLYNDILKKIGKDYYKGDFVNESLLAEASKGYIVTPLSSLIVLETQQDYERFDIKDTNNSLKNASMNSSGAVPEPHEWALIIIAIMVVIYFNRQYLFVFYQSFKKS